MKPVLLHLEAGQLGAAGPLVDVTEEDGAARRLDLGQGPFILQRRAVLVADALTVRLAAGDAAGCRGVLDDVIDLIRAIWRRGHHPTTRSTSTTTAATPVTG